MLIKPAKDIIAAVDPVNLAACRPEMAQTIFNLVHSGSQLHRHALNKERESRPLCVCAFTETLGRLRSSFKSFEDLVFEVDLLNPLMPIV